jgi:saccharopine dehydrogenase (NAD+, L-lysine-forming)
MAGGVSGGTVASMLEIMQTVSTDADARRQMNDPYTLSTDRAAEPDFGHQSDTPWRRGRDIAPELDGIWTGAFMMGGPNSRIVRRSNALLDWAYGRRFRYAENMSLGSSVAAPVAAAMSTAASAAVLALGTRYFDKLPRQLVERVVPKPGTGPSERTREKGHYTVETFTTTSSGARYRSKMAQRGDPGYKATSVLLGECGLALAFDRDELSELRGVLTPAACLGDALLARLPSAGVTLETTRLS